MTNLRALDAIRETPGIHLEELARSRHLSSTGIRRVVNDLESIGLVRTIEVSTGRIAIVPVDADIQVAYDIDAMRTAGRDLILNYLKRYPGARQVDVVRALTKSGFARSSTQHKLHRLVELGYLRATSSPSERRYFLQDRTRTMLPPTSRAETSLS